MSLSLILLMSLCAFAAADGATVQNPLVPVFPCGNLTRSIPTEEASIQALSQNSGEIMTWGYEQQLQIKDLSRSILQLVLDSPNKSNDLKALLEKAKGLLKTVEEEHAEQRGWIAQIRRWRRQRQTSFNHQAVFVIDLEEVLSDLRALSGNWGMDEGNLQFFSERGLQIEEMLETQRAELSEKVRELNDLKLSLSNQINRLQNQIDQSDGQNALLLNELAERHQRLLQIKRDLEERMNELRLTLITASHLQETLRRMTDQQASSGALIEYAFVGSLSPQLSVAVSVALQMEERRDLQTHDGVDLISRLEDLRSSENRISISSSTRGGSLILDPVFRTPLLLARKGVGRGGERFPVLGTSTFFVHPQKGLTHLDLKSFRTDYQRPFPDGHKEKLTYDNEFKPLSFSPDGRWLAHLIPLEGDLIRADIIERSSGRLILSTTSRGSAFRATPVIFLPNDQVLLMGSGGFDGYSLEQWDLRQRNVVQRYKIPDYIINATVSEQHSVVVLNVFQGGTLLLCLNQNKIQDNVGSFTYAGEDHEGIFLVGGYDVSKMVRSQRSRLFSFDFKPFTVTNLIEGDRRQHIYSFRTFPSSNHPRKIVLRHGDSFREVHLEGRLRVTEIVADKHRLMGWNYSEDGSKLFFVNERGIVAFPSGGSAVGTQFADYYLNSEPFDEMPSSQDALLTEIAGSDWLVLTNASTPNLLFYNQQTGERKTINVSSLAGDTTREGPNGHYPYGEASVLSVDGQLYLFVVINGTELVSLKIENN